MDQPSDADAHIEEQEAGEETERRKQIVDAALEEFASEGFRGATIKRIAKRARLQSHALIYWYFASKEELFQAVLGRHLPLLQLVLDSQTHLDRLPEEVLPEIARAYLAMGDRPIAQRLLRLILPEVIRRPEMIDQLGGRMIARILDFMRTYLARQVELGRLRPHDTRASARAFVGMLLPQLGGKVLLPALQTDGLSDEEHIETIVAIFLRGLRHDIEPADCG